MLLRLLLQSSESFNHSPLQCTGPTKPTVNSWESCTRSVEFLLPLLHHLLLSLPFLLFRSVQAPSVTAIVKQPKSQCR
ncbi:hypothetical protein Mapa_015716 [Marchantia paleacea]|nr:hypothetical protein Mapa_015716 [Marchantia paleacea]